ncbi:MAG: LysM peptidoglycan-binding domain-containing protein [Bacteroidota bacterium]
MSRFYLVLWFWVLSFPLLAGNGSHTNQPDSIIYLSAKDTIFLQVGDFQEKLFTHTVRQKQTLYSIAKFYGLSLSTLYFYNPKMANKVLSIDDQLTIPLPNRSILRYKTRQFNESEYIPVIYTVRPGDNLFRIARVHFKMPVDSVMLRNNLSSHNIHVGQQLQLGWVSIKGIPAKYQQNKGNLERIRNERTKQEFATYTAKRGKRAREERGIAYWQKNAREQTQLFALHRTAAINSKISVENPMQKKIVLVRVIGRIPERAYGNEVKIVLSRAAAVQLGAKDEKFFVRLQYLR